MAKFFEYQRRIEGLYYRHGMFMSNHPVIMITLSAIAILSCCYPLLNLPLPGSEPTEFLNPLSDFKEAIYTAGRSLPYEHVGVNVASPEWFQAENQISYIQQFIVKSVVNPWDEKEMIQSDSYRAPLSRLFTLLEEIQNFHLEEDEKHSISKECLHVSETLIRPGQGIKALLPEYGCLILSPAQFWMKSMQEFKNDPNILHSMHKYEGKAIKTSPSIKELLFGVPSKESGVHTSFVNTKQRVVTYAITVMLKSYDHKMISTLKSQMQSMYPSKIVNKAKQKCSPGTEGSNCENSSDSGGEVPVITHIHFKPQLGFNDLIPLLSTYFILGCYIYFSVRKINFVKSKLGMAFSAVVSIMASLMMSVGLCSLFGLRPTLNGGEVFPYLIIMIGLENILVITKSVVATPIHLDVDKRIALGLSREGCSITKNLLLELVLIGLGYFTFVPEIQEFCAFAVVGILSDYFMHMVFFTTVLSIDIRRLDITEDNYSQPQPSESEAEEESASCSSYRNQPKSMLEQLRASNRFKRYGGKDKIHKLEAGGKNMPILKIPKRLRVLFFWADTRMFQRGLMVFMVIWCALLMYGDPFGQRDSVPVTPAPKQYRTATMAPFPTLTKEPYSIFRQEKKVVTPQPLDEKGNIVWSSNDLLMYRRLCFRHWPTIFAYYNMTLAGRFISILPPIPVTISISPEEARKERHPQEEARYSTGTQGKYDHSPDVAHQHDEAMNQQLPPNSYTGRYIMTGLEYYLTLLLGAVSGMLLVFILNFLYKVVCTRNYGRQNRREKSMASVPDSIPLVLAGHPQLVECATHDEGFLASSDLSGEIRIWDIHTGECIRPIRRIATPVPKRYPGEGAIDAKPTPVGYQERDRYNPSPYINPYVPIKDIDENISPSAQYTNSNLQGHSTDDTIKRKSHSRQRSWHSSYSTQKTHKRSGSDGHHAGPSRARHKPPPLSPYSPEINLLPTIKTDFLTMARKNKFADGQNIRKRNGVINSANPDLSLSRHSSRGNLELGVGDHSRNNSTDFNFREDLYESNHSGYNFQGLLHDYYLDQLKSTNEPVFDDSPVTVQPQRKQPLSSSRSLPPPLNNSTPTTQSQLSTSLTTPLSRCHPGTARPIDPSSRNLHNCPEVSGRYSASNSPNEGTSLTNRDSPDDDVKRMWGSWESGLGQATPGSGPTSYNSSPGSPVEMVDGPPVWCMVAIKSFVITGCGNGRIEVWDSKSGLLKCCHDVGNAGVCSLAAEDTRLVAARLNGSLEFFVLEATSFNPISVQYRGPRTRHDSDKSIQDMLYSDVLTLQSVYTRTAAHQQAIVAFKMAKGRVVTGSLDHTLKVFTVQDARCQFTLYGHAASVTALTLDQGLLTGAVSGDVDGSLRVWDLPTGECLLKLEEHKDEVTAIECTEYHVVSAAQDNKLCIWARRTGMLLHVRRLDNACSGAMCLLGSSWCVTGARGHILLWDMRNGDLVRRIRLSDESETSTYRVSFVEPVGDLSVACNVGKELRIVRFPSVLEKID